MINGMDEQGRWGTIVVQVVYRISLLSFVVLTHNVFLLNATSDKLLSP